MWRIQKVIIAGKEYIEKRNNKRKEGYFPYLKTEFNKIPKCFRHLLSKFDKWIIIM